MRSLRALLIACLMGLFIQGMSFAQYTGYWKKPTPGRQANARCSLVEDEQSMIRELRRFNWDTATIPVINWKDDCAIIVAPEYYYKTKQMAFFGIEWDGDGGQYLLTWGWTEIVGESSGPGTYSAGSSNTGFEAIVVSFKHGMHSANKLVCLEKEPE